MKGSYFKYLTSSDFDQAWGIYLQVAGYTENPPNASYPLIQHPSGYHFSWEKGRILEEFQISFIVKGFGTLETKTQSHRIKPGTLFIIYPGQWHRYRPDKQTGWDEYYIGFKGDFAQKVFQTEIVNEQSSVFDIGLDVEIVNCLEKIIELSKSEHPGFHQQSAGYILTISGQIAAFVKNKGFKDKQIEKRIQEAQIEIRNKLDQAINMEFFAERYHMSYSYFRKLFKQYTGLSPSQYHLQLRLQKAHGMIRTTDQSIKQIAFDLGFESQFHFSKIFKKKFGITPSLLKK